MIHDSVAEGVSSGWRVIEADQLSEDLTLEADVAIVGTGAGGGMCAELFAQAGLRVVMIEEGPLRTSSDFRMRESEAYPDLYQELAARKTKNKAINILQGRCVGGGTTVNWTSSFETPSATLARWTDHHGVTGCSAEDMKSWFERAKQRLNIGPWHVPPNPNNEALKVGCEALGWSYSYMERNVNGCANLGYCGVGCPINAKQSMLITTIPAALAAGATLITRARAETLDFSGDRVSSLACTALDDKGVFPTGRRIAVRANQFVVAGGAIGSPALLLRSRVPDPYELLGKRTFLHPVNVCAAIMPNRVDPYSGAPQTIYSDQFLWPTGSEMGYKLEVPPMHPLLSATVLDGIGGYHAELMKQLPYMQAMLCLLRDGFHSESTGGTVQLRGDGTPVLDYPFTPYLQDGMRRALLSMTEVQFAAGATQVLPLHRDVPGPITSWSEAKKIIAGLSMEPLAVRVFSAHVMGGCPLGEDPSQAVVNSEGRHHQLTNLSVIDGSVFPTSVGTNPQVSIYAMSLKNAAALLTSLGVAS